MDTSVAIPEDLIIRSLPLNVELIELIRERQRAESEDSHPQRGNASVIKSIGRFIQLD